MSILAASKNLGIKHNVSFRVLDANTHEVIQEHTGHNAATNSMLTGIAHYLIGDGVLSQGSYMLSNYVPRYISLGTMGLLNQDEDDNGLPAGIGVTAGDEIDRFLDYMSQAPGYGADGYDQYENNNRDLFGLGPAYTAGVPVKCELISSSFPRTPISFRDVVPETESELPETIDVVFSAMISTGALAQFRNGNDYIFITEAGLWSKPDWSDGSNNGLLAGYRITPPNQDNWDMTIEENRDILKQQILRVGINQVVQIIWKIQIGAMKQMVGGNNGGGGGDDGGGGDGGDDGGDNNIVIPTKNNTMLTDRSADIIGSVTMYGNASPEMEFWREVGPEWCSSFEEFEADLVQRGYKSADDYCYRMLGPLSYNEFVEVLNNARQYHTEGYRRVQLTSDQGLIDPGSKIIFSNNLPVGMDITLDYEQISATTALDISCNLSGGVLMYKLYSDEDTFIIAGNTGVVAYPRAYLSTYPDITDYSNIIGKSNYIITSLRRASEVHFNYSVDTSKLTNFFNMPHDMRYINLYGCNFRNMVDLSGLFHCPYPAKSGTEIIEGLQSLDVSNVIYMNTMFYNCKLLRNMDLSKWDVSNAVSFKYMFLGCTGLKQVILPKRVAKPSYATEGATREMFSGCTSLEYVDMYDFSFRGISEISNMFHDCTSLSTVIYNINDASVPADIKNMPSAVGVNRD